MTQTIQVILSEAEQQLRSAGLSQPRVEAEMLLSGFLNWSRTDLYLKGNGGIKSESAQKFNLMLDRRLKREPEAYIQSQKSFFGRDFYVDSRVLIPRPETEELTEKVLSIVKAQYKGKARILDVGTGSGCIAVTMASECPGLTVVATDVSEEALNVARMNAEKMGVGEKLKFMKSDIYNGLSRDFFGYFDIIVSNPPYIPEGDISRLEPELLYEPKGALFAGQQGLDYLKPIILGGVKYLQPKGTLVLEMDPSQRNELLKTMKQSHYSQIKVMKDIYNRFRFIQGFRHG